jgi:WD40 repeat protein
MPGLRGTSSLPDWVTTLAWRPDGGMLAAACADGSVHELLPDASASAPVAHHSGGAYAVGYALDGTLASAGADGRVAIGPLPPLVVGAGWIEQLAWSPDGGLLATAVGRRVQLWMRDGSLAVETAPLPATVECLGWSPEGARLAVGGAGGLTLLGRDGEPVDEALGCEGVVLAVAWSPDRRRVACGTLDRTVYVWDVETRTSGLLEGFRRKVRELSWSANGRWLAVGGGPSPVAYSFIDGEDDVEADAETRLRGHERAVSWTAFQPSGPRLASAGEDGLLMIWYLPAEAPASVTALGSEIGTASWSPDGRRIAVGCADGSVSVLAV